MTATRLRPGAPPSLDGIGLEGPRKKSRIPEIALGLVIVAICGLGSLWWYSTAAERDEVLALREPIARGETLQVEDLVKVAIASDDPVTTMAEGEFPSIVGQVAVTDFAAGTLVTPAMFAEFNPVSGDSVVVGLDLPIGRLPAITPISGDSIAVVLVPRTAAQIDLADGGLEQASEIIVEEAIVVESAALGTQGRRFISLAVTEEEAKVISAAGAVDQVALIRIAGEIEESETEAGEGE